MFFCRKSGEQNCFSWVFPTSYSLVAIKLPLWSFTNGDKRLAILDPRDFSFISHVFGSSDFQYGTSWCRKQQVEEAGTRGERLKEELERKGGGLGDTG